MTTRSGVARVRPKTARYLELEYLDLRVSVQSETPAHLAWLGDFLSPAFSLGAHGVPHCSVTLTEDDTAFQCCRDRGPEPKAAPIDCFALNSQVIRLRRWRAPRGATSAFDEEYQVFYRVTERGRSVELVSARSNAKLRTPLMRVVRELAMNRCATQGQLVLHAAAVKAGDRAIVIAGESNAGKTTLLTYLLSEPALRYLANDRVAFDLSTDPCIVRVMPSVVTLRRDALARFPRLRQRLRTHAYDFLLTPDEATRRRTAPRRFQDGRCGLSPRQFCALLGTKPVKDARAGLLVFPQLTGASVSFRLSNVTTAEVARRLPRMLLHAGSWRKLSDLFRLPGDRAARVERLTALSRKLAERVRAVRLELGTRAYATPALTEALLNELSHPRTER